MKPRIIILLLLIGMTLSIFSCVVTSHDTYVDISCDDFSKNQGNILINEFFIEIGDKVHIDLCSNPSTGFEWSYTMSCDPAVKEEDHDYEDPEEAVPGAAGTETWTFEGIRKGTAEILMEYSQPWDGGIKQEWTYLIAITVE